MKKLTLGFSPCPNDTYMMYGLLHGQVPACSAEFEAHILDVEELNKAAMVSEFDVTKLSFKAYYDVCDEYELLSAGAALGRGNGPLLIHDQPIKQKDLSTQTVAVPGMQTTATFLLQFAFPEIIKLKPYLFSDIEAAVRQKQVDAGVIIHETRFMYAERGFQLFSDLGAVWEERTGMAIPLGCFVVKKSLPDEIKMQLSDWIKTSIQYADSHYNVVLQYIKKFAQELDNEVIKKHVEMFVNENSKALGEQGEAAVLRLFAELNKIHKKDIKPTLV